MDLCSPRVRRLLARLKDFFDTAAEASASPSSKSDSRLLYPSMKSLTPSFYSPVFTDCSDDGISRFVIVILSFSPAVIILLPETISGWCIRFILSISTYKLGL